MLEKTRGIVVHTVRYGDAGVIADVYTDRFGMLGFIAKPKRARKSAARSLMLSPLAILDIDFDYREGKSLQRAGEVRLAEPYRSLPYQPLKLTIALFLAEFLYHALRNEQANSALFDFLAGSLQWLDRRERGFANFHFALMLRLSRYLGFWPSEREVLPLLRAGEREALPFVLRMDFSSMHLFRLSREQRRRLMQVACEYYRLHLPAFPELKSMDVLREVLA
ncbi:MAG: DNA repair protein RecO C-terminal domain-containing protein [Prevotellaceae bacterium]|nr:DNA repair protein RecO C-terminal domain-containing protein [Prevotellaceae bacterium]